MLLILFRYLFNLIFYSVTVYFVLIIMERAGKKKSSNMAGRASLVVVLASGATILQLIVNAVSMIYQGWIH